MGEEAVITILAKAIKVKLTWDILEVFPSVAVATDPAVVAVGVSTLHIVPLVGLQLTILQCCRLEDLGIAGHGDVLASGESQVLFLQLLNLLLK